MLARPGLPSFDYVRANSASEVIHLLGEHGAAARLLMGGTDLLVQMRNGAVRPRLVVDVKHLPGMRDVVYVRSRGAVSAPRSAGVPSPVRSEARRSAGVPFPDERTGLTVGAAVTMNELANHPDVRAHCPLLAEAARSVASYQVRNRATVGGNLCNCSPCADTAPATLVLEGTIALQGRDGERRIPADAFFLGPGQSAIQPGEFLAAIHYPTPPPGAAGRYLKLGRSKAGDLAIVSVAIFGFPDSTAPSGYCFRIALGSVAPIVLRASAAEEVLAAGPPDEETFARAAERTSQAASPIDDVRASAAYRTAMVRNLTLRGLRQVWEQLRNTQHETWYPTDTHCSQRVRCVPL